MIRFAAIKAPWRLIPLTLTHSCGHEIVYGVPENYPVERMGDDYRMVRLRPCDPCLGHYGVCKPDVPLPCVGCGGAGCHRCLESGREPCSNCGTPATLRVRGHAMCPDCATVQPF